MKEYCIVIEDNFNYTNIHQLPYKNDNKALYDIITNIEAVQYLKDNIRKNLFLKNKTVCEILETISLYSYMAHIVKDVVSKNISIIGIGGLLLFSYDNKKEFFDRIFNK